MSTRTIRECDRCHGSLRGSDSAYTRQEPRAISHKGTPLDLCGACASKLDQFLGGQELEVPP